MIQLHTYWISGCLVTSMLVIGISDMCAYSKNVNLYILCSNGWIPGKHESYTKTTGFVDVSWLLC